MNQHKSILQLCPVKPAVRSNNCFQITGVAYCAYDEEPSRKAIRTANALKHASERRLLRGEGNSLLHQVEATPVSEITEEALLDIWLSVPREHQSGAVFLMNTSTLDALCHALRKGPYSLLSSTPEQGFRLMNKPIILCSDMPCIAPGSIPILYGDFSQVQITDQGTGKLRVRADKTFPGMDECALDAWMDICLMDRQALRGLRIAE